MGHTIVMSKNKYHKVGCKLEHSDVLARPESCGPGQAEPSQPVKSRALTFGLRGLLARLQIFQALSQGFSGTFGLFLVGISCHFLNVFLHFWMVRIHGQLWKGKFHFQHIASFVFPFWDSNIWFYELLLYFFSVPNDSISFHYSIYNDTWFIKHITSRFLSKVSLYRICTQPLEKPRLRPKPGRAKPEPS